MPETPPATFAGMVMIHQADSLLIKLGITPAGDLARSCEGCDGNASNPTGQRYAFTDPDGHAEAWCHACVSTVLWPLRGKEGFVFGTLTSGDEKL